MIDVLFIFGNEDCPQSIHILYVSSYVINSFNNMPFEYMDLKSYWAELYLLQHRNVGCDFMRVGLHLYPNPYHDNIMTLRKSLYRSLELKQKSQTKWEYLQGQNSRLQ